MSPDNWEKCPRCLKRHKDELKAKKKEIDAFYGKVDQNEYLSMIKVYERLAEKCFPSTFSEEYVHGMRPNGQYVVEYLGLCEVCGLRHEFKHIEQIDLSERK